jgi:nitrogen-specific signal transduction histidine kinase/CheY-like chemotaxis protein
MRDHQGRIVGIVGIGREITALRQAQAQLVLADRMLSVGLLAAGVAHEINNPLSAVIGNLEYAATLAAQLTAAGSGDPATLADLSCVLADTRAAADRIREVAADLRLFVRTPEREIHSVAVDQVLDASARLLRNEIRHRARIVRRYEVVPRVRASEPRLSQVFINLLVNAAQAMPIGRAEENEIRLYVHQDPAGDVVVEIADTGMGMTPEVQRRLFTPFFTTKGRDMGTGLGLSVCSRLVSGMGGRIEVQSDPGRGSTFKLVLPPDRSGAADATTVEIATPPPEWNGVRRGRILVVDDDEAVGTALRRLLTPHHEVTVSRSAKEALDHLLEGAACYDLILCDLMMPDQTGLDLLEALEVSLPDEARKVVLMTAGAFSPEAYHALASAALVVVEKPIGPDRLRDLLAARMG